MKTDQTVEEHIRHLEAYLLEPVVRSSPKELENILADDFVEFGSSGRVFDKDQIITALQQESGVKVSLKGLKVKLVSHEVALATYHTVHYTDPEGEPRYALRSSIWKYAQGRWQIVFHQGTPMDTSVNEDNLAGYNNDQGK